MTHHNFDWYINRNGPLTYPNLGRCWLWNGPGHSDGYGWYSEVRKAAHKWSYTLYKGPVNFGVCVLHKCDNRRCVRPSHLFLGTRRDNMFDKVFKNRQAQGTSAGCTKLTPNTVVRIRRLKGLLTYRTISKIFGLHPGTSRQIILGKTWRSIPW